MAIVNDIDAIVAYLKADTGVAALASTRVHGGESPYTEAGSHPRSAVVCWPAGGMPEHYVPLLGTRVDVTCYGATARSSYTLYLAVYEALKTAAREEYQSALIHEAVQSGGPLQDRDPDTHWPFTWSSWTVHTGEESIT